MKYFFALFIVFLLASSVVLAATDAECASLNSGLHAVNGVCFPSETGLSEKSIKDVIVAVLSWLLGIFGILGIIAFIISGIMYLTAAGDAEQEKKAKLAMKMAIMGIAVALAGFVIIKAIDAALNAQTEF